MTHTGVLIKSRCKRTKVRKPRGIPPLQTEDWLITHILKDREKINRKVSQLGKTGGLDWRSGHMSLLSQFALWTSDKLTNDTFIPFLKRFHILFVL